MNQTIHRGRLYVYSRNGQGKSKQFIASLLIMSLYIQYFHALFIGTFFL